MAAWTVWRRNWDVFFKTYQVNFLPPFIEPVLYLLAMGYGLGMFVGDIEGVPYVEYIAPALLAISIMNSAFFECTYSSFVRMYYQKTFDAIVATPLMIEDVITGEILSGATRSLIYASVMLIVLVAFGVVDLPSSLLIIPFAFFAGLLFSCIAMCFTAVTPGIDTLNYPAFLLSPPCSFFQGLFSTLGPPALSPDVCHCSPATHTGRHGDPLADTLIHLAPLFYSLVWIAGVILIFLYLPFTL
jgi:ABC-2 type transporter.